MTFLVPVFIHVSGLTSSLLPKKVELNNDFGVWNDMNECILGWSVRLMLSRQSTTLATALCLEVYSVMNKQLTSTKFTKTCTENTKSFDSGLI